MSASGKPTPNNRQNTWRRRLLYLAHGLSSCVVYLIRNPNRAYVLFVDQQKQEIILLQNNFGSRRWLLPGGALEMGETPRQAACRESLEEVGINPQQLTLMLTLPKRNLVKKGFFTYFICYHQKQDLDYDKKEIAVATWKPLSQEKHLRKDVGIALNKYRQSNLQNRKIKDSHG